MMVNLILSLVAEPERQRHISLVTEFNLIHFTLILHWTSEETLESSNLGPVLRK